MAIALAFFLFSGGDKKTVHGDNDLPPIAQGATIVDPLHM